MTTKTIIVPGINCGHCTQTIEMEVGDLTGVTSVNAGIKSKEVSITWDTPATWDKINSLLHEINFPPEA